MTELGNRVVNDIFEANEDDDLKKPNINSTRYLCSTCLICLGNSLPTKASVCRQYSHGYPQHCAAPKGDSLHNGSSSHGRRR